MNSTAALLGAAQNTVTDWPDAIIAVAGIALVAVVIAVVVWQIAGTWRARMLAGREEAYRKLAEEAAESQQAVQRQLTSTANDLADVRERIAEIERVLKQVE